MSWTNQTDITTDYSVSTPPSTDWNDQIDGSSNWETQGAPTQTITRAVVGTPMGLLLAITYATTIVLNIENTNGFAEWNEVTDGTTSWT
jgi:hypothetical protein